MAKKLLLGRQIRTLRRRAALTQPELARQLGISESFLSLLESDQRAVTADLLLRLAQVFDLDPRSLVRDDDVRLADDLGEVFGDSLFEGERRKPVELTEMAREAPEASRALLRLYRAYQSARADLADLAQQLSHGQDSRVEGHALELARLPSEEVSDFLQQHSNHFPELEAAADELGQSGRLAQQGLDRGLVECLRSRLGVEVIVEPGRAGPGVLRRYDPRTQRLTLAESLPPRSRSFQLAHQIALLLHRPAIERLTATGRLSTPASAALARVALASYFAGAVLMPYEDFLRAAQEVRYDIEMLGHRFRTSFEQVCHRLCTLQRPGAAGVPFHMVRVDIAGNISKRFSASGIRFARFSGACPKWNVHAAFLQPGFIRTQLSRMPDGTTYFCVARTVRREGGGYHAAQSRLAIGLGCEIGHARQLVYADGVDLGNLDAAVPIGVTCRLCERMDCTQRAFPPLLQRLDIDENVRHASFYGGA